MFDPEFKVDFEDSIEGGDGNAFVFGTELPVDTPLLSFVFGVMEVEELLADAISTFFCAAFVINALYCSCSSGHCASRS